MMWKMTSRLGAGIALALSFMLSAPSAYALDEGTQRVLGENEYMAHCAACHGVTAKGDGPVAEVLSTKPTNLTEISKRHGGKFPTDAIYHFVDGRQMIMPHGSPQMPVWGQRYSLEAAKQMANVPHDVKPEAIVHGRILALVYYLESIQVE
jgi:mono/diheme cytochrome c family protein